MDSLEYEVQNLLAQNRKIQAIKVVRERMNWGLKQAKDYVDDLATGNKPNAPQPLISDETLDWQLRELMAQGKTIQAIKLVREHKNMGLKEAKRYVESL